MKLHLTEESVILILSKYTEFIKHRALWKSSLQIPLIQFSSTDVRWRDSPLANTLMEMSNTGILGKRLRSPERASPRPVPPLNHYGVVLLFHSEFGSAGKYSQLVVCSILSSVLSWQNQDQTVIWRLASIGTKFSLDFLWNIFKEDSFFSIIHSPPLSSVLTNPSRKRTLIYAVFSWFLLTAI